MRAVSTGYPMSQECLWGTDGRRRDWESGAIVLGSKGEDGTSEDQAWR